MTQTLTRKPQSEIAAPAIARGTDKITHETFYVVQSDSQANTWYQVRWNNERLMWCCNCPARCSGCKHTRAVNEILKIRRQRIAAAMGGQVPAIVAKLQAQEDAKLAVREAAADEGLRFNPWHGSNRDGDRELVARREAYCKEFSIYE